MKLILKLQHIFITPNYEKQQFKLYKTCLLCIQYNVETKLIKLLHFWLSTYF